MGCSAPLFIVDPLLGAGGWDDNGMENDGDSKQSTLDEEIMDDANDEEDDDDDAAADDYDDVEDR